MEALNTRDMGLEADPSLCPDPTASCCSLQGASSRLTCPMWSRMPPLAIIFRVCKAICWAREPSWVSRWLSQ